MPPVERGTALHRRHGMAVRGSGMLLALGIGLALAAILLIALFR